MGQRFLQMEENKKGVHETLLKSRRLSAFTTFWLG